MHCEIINLRVLARKQFVYAFPFQNLHKTLAKLGKIPLESSKQIQQEKKSSPQVNLVNDAQSQKKPETEASTPVQSSVAKLPEISAVVKNQSQSVEVKASQETASQERLWGKFAEFRWPLKPDQIAGKEEDENGYLGELSDDDLDQCPVGLSGIPQLGPHLLGPSGPLSGQSGQFK